MEGAPFRAAGTSWQAWGGWWVEGASQSAAQGVFLSERDLSEYEEMWTTERERWVLFRSDMGYLPMRRGDPPMAEVICDEELSDLVVARMLAAGVPVVVDFQDRQVRE
ncbi:hypothetical protein JCM4814A_73690 [Streptomyces phaeofaciens JCM 4814]|uniref:Uncharacterized protein n=1 Tax=Streptomyces phaeofaciens TaxID=68254 RepID=A0A918HIG7_9ACTN|nr:hypothetical protein GCM10010226_46150 [Streptomyces phaeofaciens]